MDRTNDRSRDEEVEGQKNPLRGSPSDMPGGNSGEPGSQSSAGSRYAGAPGPAGARGENHMDPLRVDEDADPDRA